MAPSVGMRGDEVPLVADDAGNVYFEAENVNQDGMAPTAVNSGGSSIGHITRNRSLCDAMCGCALWSPCDA
jgi:hypothetical protein